MITFVMILLGLIGVVVFLAARGVGRNRNSARSTDNGGSAMMPIWMMTTPTEATKECSHSADCSDPGTADSSSSGHECSTSDSGGGSDGGGGGGDGDGGGSG
jgi:hypothetical protein